jgi:hypothetical protein
MVSSGWGSNLKLPDNISKKPDTEIGSETEFVPVEFFDPWDRQLSFDKRSNLLSPVLRDGHAEAD